MRCRSRVSPLPLSPLWLRVQGLGGRVKAVKVFRATVRVWGGGGGGGAARHKGLLASQPSWPTG